MSVFNKLLSYKANLSNSIIQYYRLTPGHFFLITCILIVTVLKLGLAGQGLLSFPDEFRYMAAEKVLKEIWAFDIPEACNAIFSTKSKPGDVILSTIPNAFQQLTGYISNIYCYDSRNSYPLFIFNFIVYCLILIVHYKFSKLLLKSSFLALISVLIFSTLTNSYLYLRHVLAYDTSLLIFYWFIYIIVEYTQDNSRLTFRKSFLIGIVSFFGYLVYPGYFPLFFLCAFLFFFNEISKKYILNRILHSFYFALGSIYCLIIFEIMSRIGNTSYIDDAIHASGIVKQGSPEESFSFLFKYLFEVEGVSGILLIVGLVIFIPLLFYYTMHKKSKQNMLMSLVGFSCIVLFLAYASIGYFFDNFYLMGRSLHNYYPFICIFFVYTISQLLARTTKNNIILITISVVFVINFGTKFTNYLSISYPRDIFWTLNETENLNNVTTVCEYTNGWSVKPGEKEYFEYLANHPQTKATSSQTIVVNGCFYYPVNNIAFYHPYIPEQSHTLIKTNPHYLNFKAYQYEGPSIAERQNIDQINFQIKIFSLESMH